jgi:hypothetical protein
MIKWSNLNGILHKLKNLISKISKFNNALNAWDLKEFALLLDLEEILEIL